MHITDFLRQAVLGIHFPQEYLCIEKENFQRPFRVVLLDQDEKVIGDVSEKNLLLGYKPVLVGFVVNASMASSVKEKFILLFSHEEKEIARLHLEIVFSRSFGSATFVVFRSVFGKHRLISTIHQRLNTFRESLRKKKAGNIYLEKNLYKQAQIAYSVPRNISMVTVSDGRLFNLFPTDLHGAIDEKYYVDSLRIDGQAARQVESIGRMVISEVEAPFFRDAYSTGKNHTIDLQLPEHFPFSNIRSEKFNWLLPDHAINYKELELESTTDIGIHRLHFFKIIHKEKIIEQANTLSHVHRYVAEWRRKNGVGTNYLIR